PLVDLGRGALLETETGVDAVADRLLILLGYPEEHADRAHRHLRAEVGDEIEAARTDERVKRPGAELPHLGLDGVHLLRCEDPREAAAVKVVRGRGREDDRSRDLDV